MRIDVIGLSENRPRFRPRGEREVSTARLTKPSIADSPEQEVKIIDYAA
jgi:hypothetical protein